MHERFSTRQIVINAGGLMKVAQEFDPVPEDMSTCLARIPENLSRIFDTSKKRGMPPHVVADEFAQKIIAERISERRSREK